MSQTGRDGQESETSSPGRRREETVKQTEGRDAPESIKEERSTPERRQGDTEPRQRTDRAIEGRYQQEETSVQMEILNHLSFQGNVLQSQHNSPL